MNAIFHNDQEAAIEQIIREIAEHINWLRQQPNANDATIQQRGRWLQAIIKYRASAQATIEEYAALPSRRSFNERHDGNTESIRARRFWDYEGTRASTIQKAKQDFPQLY